MCVYTNVKAKLVTINAMSRGGLVKSHHCDIIRGKRGLGLGWESQCEGRDALRLHSLPMTSISFDTNLRDHELHCYIRFYRIVPEPYLEQMNHPSLP